MAMLGKIEPENSTVDMLYAIRVCRSAHVHRALLQGSNGGVERFTELEFRMKAGNSHLWPAGAFTHHAGG